MSDTGVGLALPSILHDPAGSGYLSELLVKNAEPRRQADSQWRA